MGDFDAAQQRLDDLDARITALEKGGSAASPPSPLPANTESPDGTVATGPGTMLIDHAGNVFQLTAGQQIEMNGALRPETARAVELKKINGAVYQKTSFGGIWGWDAAAGAWGPELTAYPNQGGGSTTTAGPPKPAQDAGFTTLVLDEPFDDANRVGPAGSGSFWQQGLPWDGKDAGPSATTWRVTGSILTIFGPNRNVFSTQRYRHGFFYAKMWARNWGSFWMMSANHILDGDKLPIAAGDPSSWNLEIDIREGDEGHPNAQYSNYHRNTSSLGGMPDDMNQGQGSNPNGDFQSSQPIEGNWREIGCLWNDQGVSFFIVENGQWVETKHFDPYPSNGNPCVIILTAQAGGLHGGSTVDPQVTMFDDVQVWQ